jgi:hypothetical protein
MGYGPPRLLESKATSEFADFLRIRKMDDLRASLRYRKMTEVGIYSLPMGRGAESEFEENIHREFASYFPLLRNYVVEMAEKKNGLLMWLS